jgi:hypothetical protein
MFRGSGGLWRPLTVRAQLIIVRVMNGLNHICGICREIIS